MIRPIDVLIVGGGIAGLTTALAAVDRGLAVTVLDAARPGAASRAAAGMLAPSVEGLPTGVQSAAIEARDLYPYFLAGLHERAGITVPLDRNGILQLADSPEQLPLLASAAGRDAQVLDTRELADLEPALAGHPGGVLHPHDGAVDNVVLMRALDLAVAREPGIARIRDSAARVHFTPSHAVVQTAGGAQLESPAMVLATGAWASGLPGLPRQLPVRPVRGQLLRLGQLPIRHVTYGAGGYLVPRGNALIIGATSEESGFSNATTSKGLAALRSIAARAVPQLADSVVLGHWAGLRPLTPDGLPILGADPDVTQLVYACGFSRNGILFAPWAARQLASLLTGGATHRLSGLFLVNRFDNMNITS